MKKKTKNKIEKVLEALCKPSELDTVNGSGITWREWAVDQLLELVEEEYQRGREEAVMEIATDLEGSYSTKK